VVTPNHVQPLLSTVPSVQPVNDLDPTLILRIATWNIQGLVQTSRLQIAILADLEEMGAHVVLL